MSIEFSCPGCQRTLVVPDEFAGKRASCPECGAIGQIPVPAPPPAPAPPEIRPLELTSSEQVGDGLAAARSETSSSSIDSSQAAPVEPNEGELGDDRPVRPDGGTSETAEFGASSAAPPGSASPASVPSSEDSGSAANTAGLPDGRHFEWSPPPVAPPPSSGPPRVSLPEGEYFLRTPEGKSYGPVSPVELENWVRDGRVTAECDIKRSEEILWQSADRVFPALSPWRQPVSPAPLRRPQDVPRAQASSAASRVALGRDTTPNSARAEGLSSPQAPDPPLQGAANTLIPDRGILILSLGIVGVFAPCPVFSVMAWVMGTTDLQEMRIGRMDPQGLTSTQWGRVLGMLVSLVWVGIALFGTALSLYWAAS